MRGFHGDPTRAAALRHALERLTAAFPEHLAKARPPTWFEPDDLARNQRFDAILAAHRKDRRTVPIEALRATGAPYHGFERMDPRRFAWFVPALVTSWLEGAPSRARDVFGADDIEEVAAGVADDDDARWTEDEVAALDELLARAMDAAIATPLRPARTPAIERPLEDGVRVWSVHSPSVPLDVVRVARALWVPVEPLVRRWTTDPAPLALEHLIEAVYDTVVPSKRLLAWETVADRLADGFFGSTGERQERFAKAEATVRRNLGRRTDD